MTPEIAFFLLILAFPAISAVYGLIGVVRVYRLYFRRTLESYP